MKLKRFLKNVLLLGIPVLVGKYRQKNPNSAWIFENIPIMLEAQYGKGRPKEQLLKSIDDEMIKRGVSAELRRLAQEVAKQKIKEVTGK